MHMPAYTFTMRTTVEIPDELRERLVSEAARRGERGYSLVVERALRRYFAEAQSASRQETASRLRGCEVNETTAQAERKRVEDTRSRSRVGRRG